MRRIVVCDTGPLLHLSEAGAIHLLQNAGRILIPESVTKEYYQNAQGWNPPQWIEVHELDQAAQKRSEGFQESITVDLGEADAIALAIQVEADWFITDDAKARQLAESLNLESHGSIGILLWNLSVDNINGEQAKFLMDALANSSLWISNRVLDEAYKAINLLASK
jgi:predicted nucleic acid-binding protein